MTAVRINKIGVKFEASTKEEIHTVEFLTYDAVYFGRCLLTLRGKTRNTASIFTVDTGSILLWKDDNHA
jgi:hypothetical protein